MVKPSSFFSQFLEREKSKVRSYHHFSSPLKKEGSFAVIQSRFFFFDTTEQTFGGWKRSKVCCSFLTLIDKINLLPDKTEEHCKNEPIQYLIKGSCRKELFSVAACVRVKQSREQAAILCFFVFSWGYPTLSFFALVHQKSFLGRIVWRQKLVF